jgi:hypothetical protein
MTGQMMALYGSHERWYVSIDLFVDIYNYCVDDPIKRYYILRYVVNTLKISGK